MASVSEPFDKFNNESMSNTNSKVTRNHIHQLRTKFLKLLEENPNYFGTVLGSKLKAVEQLKFNTSFEEIKCIGLFPEKNQLKAVIVVKLPYGFNGDLCEQGSYEHVRFFIDWNNDGDYDDFNEDVGVASVNVHDIPQAKEKEICYTVVREFKPLPASCEKPFIVNIKAILSWRVVPTGPNFIPVWGNVVECKVQVAPTSKSEKEVQKVTEKTLKEVEVERQHFTKLLLDNPNYFGTLSDSKLESAQKIQYDTRYEQLECIGVLPEESIIAGTFKVKLPDGFDGGLCTAGSDEYFRFFIDWDNDGDFFDFNEDLGIAAVKVHDILEVKKGPLCYAVCKNFKSPQSSCHYPLIVRARVILSWKIPPTGPNFIPVWGNVLECWVQIAPTDGPVQRLIAEIIQPSPFSMPPECVTIDPLPGCVGPPQKSGIKLVGTAAGITFHHYEIEYSDDLGASWQRSGVIYPEPSPCGTSASASPTDNLQKFNAVLGYLDLTYLTPDTYYVRLTVHDSGTGTALATTIFEFMYNRVELTNVGGADVESDPTIGRKRLEWTGSEVSIGGDGVSIEGDAYVKGCGRITKQYQLSISNAYPPPVPLPLPTDAVPWTDILPTPVDYTPGTTHWFDSTCSWNYPIGELTKEWRPGVGPACSGLSRLTRRRWNTTTNGRHVIRLEEQDGPDVGPATVKQYDSVVVWLDNKDIRTVIHGIEGIGICEDVHLKKFTANQAQIKGIAWDPLIIDTATVPYTHPNDNFGTYHVSFAKQSEGSLPIPALTPTTRVPNILPGPLAVGASGVLANWDIVTAIDAGPAPSPYVPPPLGKLYRGEACTYNINLSANDTTLTGNGTTHHIGTFRFPIKIVNDL
jgi:hypothetical protein